MNFFVRNKRNFVLSVFACIFYVIKTIKYENFVFQGWSSHKTPSCEYLWKGGSKEGFKGADCLRLGKGVLKGGIEPQIMYYR